MDYNLQHILDTLIADNYNSNKMNRPLYNISVTESRAYPVYRDIMSGIYTRYFTCRSNLTKYGPVCEINADQYAGLSANPNFVCVQLPWRICGNPDDTFFMIAGKQVKNPGVKSQNKAIIIEAAHKIPALVYYLKNLLEYYQEHCAAEGTTSDIVVNPYTTSSPKYKPNIS